MPTINWTVNRDNEEIEVEVEYEVSAYDPGSTYGPPEDCYPPEGGDIEELSVTRADGRAIELTSDEEAALEKHIYETHDYSDDGGW